MDCILQRDDSLDDFLTSWRKYSTAVIAFAESHKSHKELKKCLRAIVDDEEEVESDACSECLHCVHSLHFISLHMQTLSLL